MEELSFLQHETLPALFKGLRTSLLLIVPSAALGLCIGVVAGTLRVYGGRIAMSMADLYVTLFRGVPLVVQLFTWYYGLPYLGMYLSPFLERYFGLQDVGFFRLSAFTASVIGFSLCSGAYHSEYVRGALLSIRRGQLLAAQALGFSKLQMVVFVILPQAMRRALPGCGNEVIYLIKYSSLAYMITCIELTGEAKILASHTFKYTEVFIAAGVFYLAMVSLAGWLLHFMENRYSIPGFEQHRN